MVMASNARARRPGLALAAILLLIAVPALALKQPNNVTIPTTPSLQNLFTSRGEMINALNDAADVPETFTPTCKLQFEVLQRLAGYKNSFGWYNVTGSAPALADLHEFISCNDGVGTKKPLNILKDPAYKGGDIGFYQATGPCATLQNNLGIMYSQKKYNPDSNQQNPFIHLIIYNSTVTAKAFYFCWEDLFQGGDNDFDDLTMFVTGIGCSGSGAKCDTKKLGVCADGSLQCQDGVLTCLPLSGPSTEVCDGLDNDCSGLVDEGNICPDNEVCDKGSCVPKCNSGEFKCPTGTICNSKGLCVSPACLDVTCPANTKCDGGKCVGPCDGVVCPYGQVCLIGTGTCVDPCTKFKCDPDQVCSLGACMQKCDCAGCKMGNTCMPNGLCVPNACANKSCMKGTHCDAKGDCVDDCLAVVCPKGQICQTGQCAADPNAGSGGAGGAGAGGSSGTFMLTGGNSGSQSGGQGAAGGKLAGGFEQFSPQTTSGCGCFVARSASNGSRWALLALALAATWLRRRRSRS